MAHWMVCELRSRWIRRMRAWPHIWVEPSPITLSQKELIQPKPVQRGRKRIFKPAAP